VVETPEPPRFGGLTPREAMRILQGFASLFIVVADVVEVSPPYEVEGMTALLGAQILFVTAPSRRSRK